MLCLAFDWQECCVGRRQKAAERKWVRPAGSLQCGHSKELSRVLGLTGQGGLSRASFQPVGLGAGVSQVLGE